MIKAYVNPIMLKWARRASGIPLLEASIFANIHVDKLYKYEKKYKSDFLRPNEAIPSLDEIRKLASIYKVPTALFYLSKPPCPWWLQLRKKYSRRKDEND